MSEAKPLYLTCTASQAQALNAPSLHGFLSLNQLLEAQAKSHGNLCLAGFPELVTNSDASTWTLLRFSKLPWEFTQSRVFGHWYSTSAFASLLAASNFVAIHYLETTTLESRSADQKGNRIVALLSPSCADLLVTLFAALRLGYGVLLLA